jgi:serine protease inhibitor
VEFRQKQQVSTEINKWVSEKTHGKIRNVVDQGDFKSRSLPGIIDEPGLVTVNAIYFKADWGSQFDKNSIRVRPFHVDGEKTEETMMMQQSSLLPYSEKEKFKFLEIPYIDNLFSMYVILPREIISLSNLMEGMTMEIIFDLKQKAFSHMVDVIFPKFEMKTHLAAKNIISAMGVNTAFDKGKADFERMISKKIEAFRIYINEIYHDAWIETAAVTTTKNFTFGCIAAPISREAQFHADHPFLFLIVHNQSRSILFAGWVSNPGKIQKQ